MGQGLEIEFLEHRSFTRKIGKFNKKYDGGIGYKRLKNLLKIHFHPTHSELKLTPKVLRRVDRIGANVKVYKVTMVVKGLKQGQSPRVCFRFVGNLIIFLCFGVHIENYKDSELKELVKKRIRDLDPDVQFNLETP